MKDTEPNSETEADNIEALTNKVHAAALKKLVPLISGTTGGDEHLISVLTHVVATCKG